MNRIQSFWVTYRWYMFLIGVVVFLTYVTTLRNAFVWDDQTYIVAWPEIQSAANIPTLLSGDLPGSVTGTYRPLRSLHYVASYALFGTNPTAWHLQAIVLHTIAGVLVFILGILLTDTILVALPAALLFSAHPINSEAVAFATASMDIPGIIYLLLSLITFTLSLPKYTTKLLLLSLVFAACAYLSHEQTLILPLLIWLVHSWHEQWFVTTKKQITIVSLYVLPVCVYFILRFMLFHVGLRDSSLHADYLNTLLGSMLKVWRYAETMIVPIRLTSIADFPYGSGSAFGIPIPQALLRPYVWTTLVSLLLFFIWLPTRLKRNPATGFFTGWIAVSLLPVINILPTNLTYAERYMYLPSVGFSLGLAWLLYLLSHSATSRHKTSVNVPRLRIFVAVIVLLYCTRTILRTLDYRTNITLWSVVSRQSPKSDAVWNNLGNAYASANYYVPAIESFRKAAGIKPKVALYHSNLGNALIASGDLSGGQHELETARSLDSRNISAIISLSDSLTKQGKPDDAVHLLESSIAQNPSSPQLFFALGTVELGQGQSEKARRAYEKAISLNPAFSDVYNNLAVLYLSQNNPESAVRVLSTAIEKNTTDAALYYNLGSAYEVLKDDKRALESYTTAVRLNPAFTEAVSRKDALTNKQ